MSDLLIYSVDPTTFNSYWCIYLSISIIISGSQRNTNMSSLTTATYSRWFSMSRIHRLWSASQGEYPTFLIFSTNVKCHIARDILSPYNDLTMIFYNSSHSPNSGPAITNMLYHYFLAFIFPMENFCL